MLTAFLAAAVVVAVTACSALVVALLRRELSPSELHWSSTSELHWSSTLPFLGGREPDTHAWGRFHARYYPMSLVLVAFEMEMMFMYPWAVVYGELGVKALAEMGVFLGLLSLGIVYAWREGAFRWQ